MAKAVLQYLRGLDLTGVHLGPEDRSYLRVTDGDHDSSSTVVVESGVKRNTKDLWPSTDVLSTMCRLQWLKLRQAGLEGHHLPLELAKLSRLEILSLNRNSLTRLSSLKNWPTILPALRSLTCRRNELTDHDAIPSDIFECPNLQVVDFSCNRLTSIPKGIEQAKGLLVLNLSHNKITSVTPDLFVQCTDLMLLDLSDNELTNLPAQLRRCTSLQQLILSENPLSLAHFRAVTALRGLEILRLADTQRRLDNIPSDLSRLDRLTELDFSNNSLTRIPEPVLELRSLRKLNISRNVIEDLSQVTDNWPKLEFLDVSSNNLTHLPTGLTRLTALRKLYVGSNRLTFTGIPPGIGKLQSLEVFDASFNQLENIPESLCRIGRLKRLNLYSNRLLTLPDAIHYLRESLEDFDVSDNPNLIFPPKPVEEPKGAGLAYYNIDFSLESQLRLLVGKRRASQDTGFHAKDSATRLRRLCRRHATGTGQDSSRVLEGMQRVAREKEDLLKRREEEIEEEAKVSSARRWQDQLNKPKLDYTGIFDESAGTVEGVEMWELDEFYPKRVEDDVLQGRLLDGDCYIILSTKLSSGHNLDWDIYYWIGSRATRDKQTCAAIHAVNLRNLLGAENRTFREEQDDESEDFLDLFGGSLMVLEGARGESGFFRVEEQEVVTKLYRLFGTEKHLLTVSMPATPLSLDPKFCYILDAQSRLFLWLGSQSRLMVRTKGRLLIEKIAVRERRGEATIHLEPQGRESNMFWAVLTGQWLPPTLTHSVHLNNELDTTNTPRTAREEDASTNPSHSIPTVTPPVGVPRDFIRVDWKPPHPVLFDVQMGKGFLELPQVELVGGQLTKGVLDSKHVYLLDSGGELYVWTGQKSTQYLRFAGYRLAQELADLMPRGCLGGADAHAFETNDDNAKPVQFTRPMPQLCVQGSETQMFRIQFIDLDEALAVDYTRTSESVARRGADPKAILEKDRPKVDMRALLTPRENAMEWTEAMQLMSDWNEELVEPIGPDLQPNESLKQFILSGGKWVRIDPQWFGQLFNQDSFVIIARYWDFDDQQEEPGEEADADIQEEVSMKHVVYFWQGREASDLHWLTFNFSVRKDMEKLLSQGEDNKSLKVEFKRVHQQQEDLVLLAHFQRQLIIHNGRYADRSDSKRTGRIQMYYIRANGNPISTRCIEITPSATYLNSHFCFLVKIPGQLLIPKDHPSDAPAPPTRVFMWIGKETHPDDKELIHTLGKRLFAQQGETVFDFVYEGTENGLFWLVIGGRKPYDPTADYLLYGRLFRLSNDQGFFCASEKCADFCQDDLADEDVMLLDTGHEIYLWWGKRTSDVEQKLSLQAAKLYKTHLTNVQPDRPRQLKLTMKYSEPFLFKRCFHGWGPFREPKDWSG